MMVAGAYTAARLSGQDFLWHDPSPDPLNWQHNFLTIEDIKLHYVTYHYKPIAGQNPDIVFLLHCFPDSWAIWYPFLEHMINAQLSSPTTSLQENTVFV